ncbi:MAG: GTP-binding protein [Geminocystis sp.]|nr:GTP-binding protein [Geminocystis sp.]MCX8077082.1 GTP-binding protein [Geminocystis sp.]MDW8115594.1 GTP-binding protein [Geminocystis sp.]HIK36689.1 DUF697 domain-containing protein [Geminocystis sp. M7585_C2015_104]
MSLSQIIALIVGLSIILGLGLWLVTSLARLYSEIAWTSPLLANLLVFVIIILLVSIGGIVIYYLGSGIGEKGKRKERKRKKIEAKGKKPGEKKQIAQETLQGLKKQLAQIQDEVAKRALLAKQQAIEASLKKGCLKVVVFGTGSAGKTSLVNALMGEIVGEVKASMGTTKEEMCYTLKLPNVEREITLIDTPGVQEMGVPGDIREKLARELAVSADLLIFVCDNDLTATEFKILKALASIGKRTVLVFNKIDLYSEEEQETIMRQLKERVKGIIPPEDVIKACANPQPIQFAEGETITPEVEVTTVVRRIAAICRAEGDDLLADNILLQSKQLGEEAKRLISRQRNRQAEQIINRYQWIGAGVIVCTPLPVIDMLAAAAVNAQMVVEIGQVYGCQLNRETGRDLAVSLGKTLVSLGIVKGVVEIVARTLQATAATYLVGKVIQAISAAYLTRIAGKSFIEYFSHDQDWGDGGITEVVQRQFELNRKEEFIRAFVQDAIERVIEPIRETLDFRETTEEEGDWEEEWGDWL